MTSKKQRMVVYGVAVHLLLISIICYAAFPLEAPEEPIRLMYQTNAGRVLFDHKTHAQAEGFGLACADCHHDHPEGETMDPIACNACHPSATKISKLPESCLDCHEAADIREPQIMKRAAALHQQCSQCHEQYNKGPKYISDECSRCHVTGSI